MIMALLSATNVDMIAWPTREKIIRLQPKKRITVEHLGHPHGNFKLR